MRMWQQLDFLALLDTLASLLLAFVLGSLVGLERQYRQRTAGLRTNVLVAVGAALFVNLAQRGYYDGLKVLLDRMIEKGLSSPERQQGICFVEDLEQIKEILQKSF